jgi:hypothetical protein
MAGADKNLSVIAFRDGRTDAAATVLNSTPEEPTTFTVRDWLYLLWSGARCQRKLQAVTYRVDRPIRISVEERLTVRETEGPRNWKVTVRSELGDLHLTLHVYSGADNTVAQKHKRLLSCG